MRRLVPHLVLGFLMACTLGAPSQAESTISFARDIRPVLSDKCFACHGPDEKSREADLRLDVRDDAVSSEAIVPGSADESEMFRRIVSEVEDERMPPTHLRKELTDQEVDLIRRWIDAGAPYETHWAYRKLTRPKVPAIKHPRANNAIDAFILDALASRDLDFAEPADRRTLVRRLYLDLLGVPPTPSEAEAFIHSDAPDAVESLVEQLLHDKRFGERMAVYWLDLVRYADTIGYHSDTYMEVSAYRDYVINAFNDNKPFDQFTVEQLAGDLLPAPTDMQRVASGYNRLLQTTEEGGAQAKEYIAIYAADRVRNVSGVWMGSTVGCAQCHDHKYDPFTMRDFYSLAAFFADIKENAIGKRRPNFKLVSEADNARIQSLKEKIEGLRLPRLLENNQELAASVAEGQKAWEAKSKEAAESESSVWRSPTPHKLEATGGVVLVRQDDGSYLSTKGNPDRGTYTYTLATSRKIHAVRLEAISHASFPNQGFARGNGNFVLTGVSISAGDQKLKIEKAIADYEQPGWPIANVLDGKAGTGWAVDGHQRKAKKRTAVFYLQEPVDLGSEDGKLTIELDHQSAHARHLVGQFRISVTDQPAPLLDDSQPIPDELLVALKLPEDQRTEAQSKTLAEHYRKIARELEPFKKQLVDTEKELKDLEAGLRTTLVTEALPTPRMTRILPRGNWLDDSGDVVEPAVPEFLRQREIEGRRATRLDLAEWLVDENNPLTARTFVNRLWKLYFGQGLSPNLDDLGGQGQPPTHPELLDWLAVEFRDSGWDIKHLVKLITTSSTYAQSSVTNSKLRTIDPDNRWYARQGRWRLEAEFVRDAVLSFSGLLVNDQIGGRSVKPYQPAGYWRHLNFPKRTWQSDRGENLYRRSLYTFWCRTFLHPAMLAFDATSREECTAQRARSNIPQQALVLLNDPEFLESARVFAANIQRAEGDVDAKIDWAFRTALSRTPEPAETQLMKKLYQQQRTRYQSAADDADALLSVGEYEKPSELDRASYAAWTQVARAIINLYETTSRF